MPKTVFISGASSGFGEACARQFSQAGYSLILTGRREDRLAKLGRELSEHSSVHWFTLDVRQRDEVESRIQAIPDAFQNIDILINNAGLALGIEPAQQCSLDDWDTMIDTNIKGLTYLTRAILPKMIHQKIGHIINIGSTAGAWPYPGGNTYGGTKAFVEQFSRGLRADVQGENIKVSCLAPGLSETEFSIVRMKGDTEKANKVYQGTQPLSAQDIADIIVWIAQTPPHVNVNFLEVMPTCQAWGPLTITRT